MQRTFILFFAYRFILDIHIDLVCISFKIDGDINFARELKATIHNVFVGGLWKIGNKENLYKLFRIICFIFADYGMFVVALSVSFDISQV